MSMLPPSRTPARVLASDDEQVLARSGEECVRVAQSALAGHGETRNIPIVMVTGLIDGKDRLRALKAGAVDFLSKPFQPDELVAKVQSLARLKAYHDEMQRQQVGLMVEIEGSPCACIGKVLRFGGRRGWRGGKR